MFVWDTGNEMFSPLTARSIFGKAHEQVLIIRALQKCNRGTQSARCPAPGQVVGRPLKSRFSGS